MKQFFTAATTGTFMLLLSTAGAVADQEALVEKGKEVFGDLCLSCHDPATRGADRVAPPVFAVKNHYANYREREAFVNAMSAFILSPSVENSRMPGAIGRFELMPDLELSEEDARAAAEFIFATDFSLPDWYAKHYEEEHGEAPPSN